jgi:hypothetical protein
MPPKPEGHVQFSREQLDQVARAVDEAEARTTRYYCIPPFRWQELPYDLLTRQDHEWEPLPDPILAQVRRMQKANPKSRPSFEFYRIQLNDPSILSVAQREKLNDDIYSFLVCILTHEMVHMVRLSSILENEKAALLECETEESRVHRISRQILSGSGYNPFHSILDKFSIA